MLTVRKFCIIVAAVAVAVLLCVVVFNVLSRDFASRWKFRIIIAAVAGLLCVVVLSRDFASSDGNSA